MATLAKKAIKPWRRKSGGPIEPTYFPEALSQTFKMGEPVYLVAGYVTAFSDNDSNKLLGFAAEDAHNGAAGANRVGVYLPDDDLMFIGTLYHGTAASAIAAVTDIGTLLPLTTVASNQAYLDKADTGGLLDMCRIQEIYANIAPAEEVIGDIYPRVIFTITAAARLIGQ